MDFFIRNHFIPSVYITNRNIQQAIPCILEMGRRKASLLIRQFESDM